MTKRAAKKCDACAGEGGPLRGSALREWKTKLGRGWRIVRQHQLEREFAFDDFARALKFTNRVGALAEKLGHHPDIYLAWGKVTVTTWTHSAGGLTGNDFVLAAKVDALPGAR